MNPDHLCDRLLRKRLLYACPIVSYLIITFFLSKSIFVYFFTISSFKSFIFVLNPEGYLMHCNKYWRNCFNGFCFKLNASKSLIFFFLLLDMKFVQKPFIDAVQFDKILQFLVYPSVCNPVLTDIYLGPYSVFINSFCYLSFDNKFISICRSKTNSPHRTLNFILSCYLVAFEIFQI